MVTITRRLEFDYGHRVLGHEGKCAHLHGHRGVAEITVKGNLDPLGRVIDFSVVKAVVGKWIDDNWDHNVLLHPHDPLVKAIEYINGRSSFVDLFCNPTAENMAQYLFSLSTNLLNKYGVIVTRVRVYETPNSFADCFSLPDNDSNG